MAIATEDILVDAHDGLGQRLIARKGQPIPEQFADHPDVKGSVADDGSKEADAAQQAAAGGDYDAMNKDQLRAAIDERGLDVPADARKADMIAALEGADGTA